MNTNKKRLLLLSNSANPGEERLAHAQTWIQDFLGKDVRTLAFIGYAALPNLKVDGFKKLAEILSPTFEKMGYELVIPDLHLTSAFTAIDKADAIVVTGGNTFFLLKCLSELNLLPFIRERVLYGMPYVGWSAGSNVTCPTIMTTNDMPISNLPSLKALDLISFPNQCALSR
jgi:dipeptidase E